MPLSTNAQNLQNALMNEAQSAATRQNVGYAVLHEDRVGGLAEVQAEIDELNAAGVKVLVSAGERDRYIQLDGVRVAA